jgi:DNA (cytosine-5)-methyltransferase 1
MAAYYNEFDPYAAQWLQNLIDSKLIADGDVDDRSIRDVAPSDLKGYTQCHFFAGIGVWSYALRLAGWPDDRPVWTGSCPCQPFSAAGKGAGFADERHLWPEFYRLIAECRPPVVFGEQVASKDGLAWIDTVQSDMEASGYAIGAADLCAAGVGAPHIRQRLWFVGERLDDTAGARHVGTLARAEGEARDEARLRLSGEGRGSGGLANTSLDGRRQGIADGGRLRSGDRAEGSAGRPAIDGGLSGGLGHYHHQGLEGQRSGHQAEGGRLGAVRPVAEAGELGWLADAKGAGSPHGGGGAIQPIASIGGGTNGGLEHASSLGRERGQAPAPGHDDDGSAPGGQKGEHGAGLTGSHRLHQDGARPTNGRWRAADWLFCRDGKWRPVEPGTFPLAHGAPARVGRLRAYGNAIVPQVAAEVIGAYLAT